MSSLLDILIVSAMATHGILMAPIPILLVGAVLSFILFYLVILDFLKIKMIGYSHLR